MSSDTEKPGAAAHVDGRRPAPGKGPKVRQAVVVIHGIGEQRPMRTLRGFVNAVLPDHYKTDVKFRSKFDRMSESFELRCLQAPANTNFYYPQTEFYEYYWAHHMSGSHCASVTAWLLKLLFRKYKEVPGQLRPLYIASWVILSLALLGLLAGLFWGNDRSGLVGRVLALPEQWPFRGSLLLLAGQYFLDRFMLRRMGEAARYLTPNPENIEVRNKIRGEGAALLRKLHESGKYSRIVVVGHSLGSVIGYDIIRQLWGELHKPEQVAPVGQEQAKLFDKTLDADITTKKFQEKQFALWREYREVGIPWLVSDFITLGSPLAHASFLLADSASEFNTRKQEFELPVCPPLPDPKKKEVHYPAPYQVKGGSAGEIRNMWTPHRGAPFAVTRWTNLYFPADGLHGDVIGGPLAGVFGRGIRDVMVRPGKAGWLRSTWYCHTCYWETVMQWGTKQPEGAPDASTALAEALNLACGTCLETYPHS